MHQQWKNQKIYDMTIDQYLVIATDWIENFPKQTRNETKKVKGNRKENKQPEYAE